MLLEVIESQWPEVGGVVNSFMVTQGATYQGETLPREELDTADAQEVAEYLAGDPTTNLGMLHFLCAEDLDCVGMANGTREPAKLDDDGNIILDEEGNAPIREPHRDEQFFLDLRHALMAESWAAMEDQEVDPAMYGPGGASSVGFEPEPEETNMDQNSILQALGIDPMAVAIGSVVFDAAKTLFEKFFAPKPESPVMGEAQIHDPQGLMQGRYIVAGDCLFPSYGNYDGDVTASIVRSKGEGEEGAEGFALKIIRTGRDDTRAGKSKSETVTQMVTSPTYYGAALDALLMLRDSLNAGQASPPLPMNFFAGSMNIMAEAGYKNAEPPKEIIEAMQAQMQAQQQQQGGQQIPPMSIVPPAPDGDDAPPLAPPAGGQGLHPAVD